MLNIRCVYLPSVSYKLVIRSRVLLFNMVVPRHLQLFTLKWIKIKQKYTFSFLFTHFSCSSPHGWHRYITLSLQRISRDAMVSFGSEVLARGLHECISFWSGVRWCWVSLLMTWNHAVDTGTVHLMLGSPSVLHLMILKPAGIII